MQAVNVRKVEHPSSGSASGLILEYNRKVPVAPPFWWNQRIVVEYIRTAISRTEIVIEALIDRQAWCDKNKVPRHLRFGFAKRVKIAPDNRKAHHFCFARSSSELKSVSAPGVFLFSDAESGNFFVRPSEFSNE